MEVRVNGELPRGVTAKDVVLGISSAEIFVPRVRDRGPASRESGKIHGEPQSNQIGKLFGRKRHSPAIEIASFLIEPRENARKELRIVRVAVSRRVRAYPSLGIVRAGLRRTVVDGFKIGDSTTFPCGRIAFGDAAAGLGKPRIADGAAITQKLAGRRADRLGRGQRECFRDALVTLAVIVGAHIEIRMGFAAIPSKDFVGSSPHAARSREGPRSSAFGNHNQLREITA